MSHFFQRNRRRPVDRFLWLNQIDRSVMNDKLDNRTRLTIFDDFLVKKLRAKVEPWECLCNCFPFLIDRFDAWPSSDVERIAENAAVPVDPPMGAEDPRGSNPAVIQVLDIENAIFALPLISSRPEYVIMPSSPAM